MWAWPAGVALQLLLLLPLLPATSGKHFRHLEAGGEGGRGGGGSAGGGNLCAVFVLSRRVWHLTQLPVLNTKDTASSPRLLRTSCSLPLPLPLPLGVKNLRIKFPYQQFYLQQFGNTFVWHTAPSLSLSLYPSPCSLLLAFGLGLAVTYQFPLDCIKKRKSARRG